MIEFGVFFNRIEELKFLRDRGRQSWDVTSGWDHCAGACICRMSTPKKSPVKRVAEEPAAEETPSKKAKTTPKVWGQWQGGFGYRGCIVLFPAVGVNGGRSTFFPWSPSSLVDALTSGIQR